MDERPSKALPIALVLSSLIIGAAILMVWGGEPEPATGSASVVEATQSIPAVTSADHYLGNPNAPIVIVEYTDLECPFCKNFHFTMKQLMDDYGKRGEIAWVVRNFPIPQLHPKALKEHEAAECAAELGGHASYFAYIDKVFARTPSNNGLNHELLPVMAAEIGLDKVKFAECLASGRHAELVKKQAADAFAGGASGTPHNVIFFKGERMPLPGAQPYQAMRGVIDTLLARANGQENAIPAAF